MIKRILLIATIYLFVLSCDCFISKLDKLYQDKLKLNLYRTWDGNFGTYTVYLEETPNVINTVVHITPTPTTCNGQGCILVIDLATYNRTDVSISSIITNIASSTNVTCFPGSYLIYCELTTNSVSHIQVSYTITISASTYQCDQDPDFEFIANTRILYICPDSGCQSLVTYNDTVTCLPQPTPPPTPPPTPLPTPSPPTCPPTLPPTPSPSPPCTLTSVYPVDCLVNKIAGQRILLKSRINNNIHHFSQVQVNYMDTSSSVPTLTIVTTASYDIHQDWTFMTGDTNNVDGDNSYELYYTLPYDGTYCFSGTTSSTIDHGNLIVLNEGGDNLELTWTCSPVSVPSISYVDIIESVPSFPCSDIALNTPYTCSLEPYCSAYWINCITNAYCNNPSVLNPQVPSVLFLTSGYYTPPGSPTHRRSSVHFYESACPRDACYNNCGQCVDCSTTVGQYDKATPKLSFGSDWETTLSGSGPELISTNIVSHPAEASYELHRIIWELSQIPSAPAGLYCKKPTDTNCVCNRTLTVNPACTCPVNTTCSTVKTCSTQCVVSNSGSGNKLACGLSACTGFFASTCCCCLNKASLDRTFAIQADNEVEPITAPVCKCTSNSTTFTKDTSVSVTLSKDTSGLIGICQIYSAKYITSSYASVMSINFPTGSNSDVTITCVGAASNSSTSCTWTTAFYKSYISCCITSPSSVSTTIQFSVTPSPSNLPLNVKCS